MANLHYVQHHDDEGIDQILIMVESQPFLRAIMRPRYKTSSLSGNEWRVSAIWQRLQDGEWEDLDGPYHNLRTAGSAIFCGVYSSHIGWHHLVCTSVRLLRKERPVIEMTNDGNPLPLLEALGHLPWSLEIWTEQLPPEAPGYFGGDVTKDLCFQVGCTRTAISTYALKQRYRSDGSSYESNRFGFGQDARRFCAKHLRRGDCGRDDADRNYQVIEGPGPSKSTMESSDESPSQRVVLGP